MTTDKKQELLEAISNNPELRLIAMFSNGGDEEYRYSLGQITKVEVTEVTEYDDVVYFSDEEDVLREVFEDHFFDEIYGDEPYGKVYTDEENEELEELARKKLAECEWENVIVIYVSN